MAMNIKNDEAERLSRELAAATGETITTAVTVAVRERLGRVHRTTSSTHDRSIRAVELGRQIAATLRDHPTSDDLYDDQGLPR